MMPPKGKLRTRLVVIFVALVGGPLLVTGVLLSVAGRNRVESTGRSLNRLGRRAYEDVARQVSETVTDSLHKTGKQLGQIGHREFLELGAAQSKQSTDALRRAGQGLMKTRDDLLRKSNEEMIAASNDVVRMSGSSLRQTHQSALDEISKALINQSKGAFARTEKEVAENTKAMVEDLAEELNDQRAKGLAEYVELFFADDVAKALDSAKTALATANDPSEQQAVIRDLKTSYLYAINAATFDADGQVLAPHLAEVAGHQTRWKPLMEEAVREKALRYSPLFSLRQMMTVSVAAPLLNDSGEVHRVLVVDLSLQRIQNNVHGLVAATRGAVSIFSAGNLVVAHQDSRQLGKEAAGEDLLILNEVDKVEQNPPPRRERNTITFGVGDDRQLCAYVTKVKPFGWTVVVRQPMKAVIEKITLMQARMMKGSTQAAQGMEAEAMRLATAAVDRVKPLEDSIVQDAAGSVRKANQRVLDASVKRLNEEQARVTNEAVRKTQQAVVVAAETAGASMDQEANRAMAATTSAVRDKTERTVRGGLEQMRSSTYRSAGQAASEMLRRSLFLLAVFLFLAILVAVATASSIVRPILQLAGGAGAIAEGDYSRRVSVGTHDEIGALAESFNAMASAVEQSRDILAFEKSRLQAIVESSPDGLLTENDQGNVLLLNASALSLLLLPSTTPLNQPVTQLQLEEEELDRLRQCCALAQNETPRDFVIEGASKHILQVRSVPVRDEHGRTHGRLLTLHDVTQAREIDLMKTDFVSMVSHELRTPLTSILGFSSYLLTGKLGSLTEEQRTALESMHRQSTRLKAIIADFLDISRIESGSIEMGREHVDIAEIARRVIEELRPTWQEKRLRVAVDESTATNARAIGDEQRLAQVFTNLLGNAIKFTERGEIVVRLFRAGRELIVEVRDTGIGIPEDELPRVFDRFYQVEKVVTRKTGGTGLGLAIVKNIVEAHSGRITANSEFGNGTVFRITLPAAVRRVQAASG